MTDKLPKNLHIAVLMGGWSTEREVSLMSGNGVADALEKNGYRVSRVEAATGREEPFDRPSDFDLATWWAASTARFDRSLWRFAVRMRLGPRAWRLAPQALTGSSIEVARAEAGPADAAGWHEVVVHLESEEVALEQLLSLGGEVEVVAPPSLRRSLAEVGLAMARCNGTDVA